MAEVLFEIPEWLDYADYDNYPSESKPTTNADFINYSRNQNKLVGALTGAFLWQPNTNFIEGKIIITPNMPEGMEAVALTGGFTGTVEPAWESDIAEYQDSGVKWQLRYQHWSKEVASVDDMKNGTSNDKLVTPKLARLGQTATNRLPNTAYVVGNIVYDRSNLSVALKCTQAGTTSNTELDISGKVVGGSVTDGSVEWKIIERSNALDEGGVLPIVNGGTGANTGEGARENLLLNVKTYRTLSEIGLDNNASEADIMNALPLYSMLSMYFGHTEMPNMELSKSGVDGELVVFGTNSARNLWLFKPSFSHQLIVGDYWAPQDRMQWKDLSMAGKPDFSSQVTIATLPFTAPTDCFVMIYATRNASSSAVGWITINGMNILAFNNVEGKMTGDVTTQLWLKQGDVVNVSGNARFGHGYYFYERGVL